MAIIKKIQKKYKKLDFITFCLFVIKKIFNPVFYMDILLVYQIDLDSLPTDLPVSENFSVRFGNEEDLKDMNVSEHDFSDHEKSEAIMRLKKGDRFAISFYKGKIAGYDWIMKGEIELAPRHPYVLPDNKVYNFKAFIIEEFRGKRIAVNMFYFIVNALKSEKIRYSVSFIKTDNLKSINAIKKLGAGHIGKYFRLTLFKKYHYVFMGKTLKKKLDH